MQYTDTMPHKTPEARRAYYREYIALREAADPGYKTRRFASFARYVSAEAKAARERVRRALQSGKLTRPDSCERCSGPGPIDAAHIDYSRALDVRWLCKPCHRRFDQASRTTSTAREAGPHNREKTHCPQGHPYDDANTGPTRGGTGRRCRQCNRESERRRRLNNV